MADNYRSLQKTNGHTRSHFHATSENAAFTKQTSNVSKPHILRTAKFPEFGSHTKHEARFYSSVKSNTNKRPGQFRNDVMSDYYPKKNMGQV